MELMDKRRTKNKSGESLNYLIGDGPNEECVQERNKMLQKMSQGFDGAQSDVYDGDNFLDLKQGQHNQNSKVQFFENVIKNTPRNANGGQIEQIQQNPMYQYLDDVQSFAYSENNHSSDKNKNDIFGLSTQLNKRYLDFDDQNQGLNKLGKEQDYFEQNSNFLADKSMKAPSPILSLENKQNNLFKSYDQRPNPFEFQNQFQNKNTSINQLKSDQFPSRTNFYSSSYLMDQKQNETISPIRDNILQNDKMQYSPSKCQFLNEQPTLNLKQIQKLQQEQQQQQASLNRYQIIKQQKILKKIIPITQSEIQHQQSMLFHINPHQISKQNQPIDSQQPSHFQNQFQRKSKNSKQKGNNSKDRENKDNKTKIKQIGIDPVFQKQYDVSKQQTAAQDKKRTVQPSVSKAKKPANEKSKSNQKQQPSLKVQITLDSDDHSEPNQLKQTLIKSPVADPVIKHKVANSSTVVPQACKAPETNPVSVSSFKIIIPKTGPMLKPTSKQMNSTQQPPIMKQVIQPKDVMFKSIDSKIQFSWSKKQTKQEQEAHQEEEEGSYDSCKAQMGKVMKQEQSIHSRQKLIVPNKEIQGNAQEPISEQQSYHWQIPKMEASIVIDLKDCSFQKGQSLQSTHKFNKQMPFMQGSQMSSQNQGDPKKQLKVSINLNKQKPIQQQSPNTILKQHDIIASSPDSKLIQNQPINLSKQAEVSETVLIKSAQQNRDESVPKNNDLVIEQLNGSKLEQNIINSQLRYNNINMQQQNQQFQKGNKEMAQHQQTEYQQESLQDNLCIDDLRPRQRSLLQGMPLNIIRVTQTKMAAIQQVDKQISPNYHLQQHSDTVDLELITNHAQGSSIRSIDCKNLEEKVVFSSKKNSQNVNKEQEFSTSVKAIYGSNNSQFDQQEHGKSFSPSSSQYGYNRSLSPSKVINQKSKERHIIELYSSEISENLHNINIRNYESLKKLISVKQGQEMEKKIEECCKSFSSNDLRVQLKQMDHVNLQNEFNFHCKEYITSYLSSIQSKQNKSNKKLKIEKTKLECQNEVQILQNQFIQRKFTIDQILREVTERRDKFFSVKHDIVLESSVLNQNEDDKKRQFDKEYIQYKQAVQIAQQFKMILSTKLLLQKNQPFDLDNNQHLKPSKGNTEVAESLDKEKADNMNSKERGHDKEKQTNNNRNQSLYTMGVGNSKRLAKMKQILQETKPIEPIQNIADGLQEQSQTFLPSSPILGQTKEQEQAKDHKPNSLMSSNQIESQSKSCMKIDIDIALKCLQEMMKLLCETSQCAQNAKSEFTLLYEDFTESEREFICQFGDPVTNQQQQILLYQLKKLELLSPQMKNENTKEEIGIEPHAQIIVQNFIQSIQSNLNYLLAQTKIQAQRIQRNLIKNEANSQNKSSKPNDKLQQSSSQNQKQNIQNEYSNQKVMANRLKSYFQQFKILYAQLREIAVGTITQFQSCHSPGEQNQQINQVFKQLERQMNHISNNFIINQQTINQINDVGNATHSKKRNTKKQIDESNMTIESSQKNLNNAIHFSDRKQFKNKHQEDQASEVTHPKKRRFSTRSIQGTFENNVNDVNFDVTSMNKYQKNNIEQSENQSELAGMFQSQRSKIFAVEQIIRPISNITYPLNICQKSQNRNSDKNSDKDSVKKVEVNQLSFQGKEDSVIAATKNKPKLRVSLDLKIQKSTSDEHKIPSEATGFGQITNGKLILMRSSDNDLNLYGNFQKSLQPIEQSHPVLQESSMTPNQQLSSVNLAKLPNTEVQVEEETFDQDKLDLYLSPMNNRQRRKPIQRLCKDKNNTVPLDKKEPQKKVPKKEEVKLTKRASRKIKKEPKPVKQIPAPKSKIDISEIEAHNNDTLSDILKTSSAKKGPGRSKSSKCQKKSTAEVEQSAISLNKSEQVVSLDDQKQSPKPVQSQTSIQQKQVANSSKITNSKKGPISKVNSQKQETTVTQKGKHNSQANTQNSNSQLMYDFGKNQDLNIDNNQRYSLVACDSFPTFETQPYRIYFTFEVQMVMYIHSYLSKNEVIGLLGGNTFETNIYLPGSMEPVKYLVISKIYTADSCIKHATGRQKNCEISDEEQVKIAIQMEKDGVQKLAWYHSHPIFEVDPSVQDLWTHHTQQVNFSKEGKPFFGVIIGPYWKSQEVQETQFIVFNLKEQTCPSKSVKQNQRLRPSLNNLKDRAMKYHYKIIPNTKLKYSMYSDIKKMIYSSSMHKIDRPEMANEWTKRRGSQGFKFTFKEKFMLSLKKLCEDNLVHLNKDLVSEIRKDLSTETNQEVLDRQLSSIDVVDPFQIQSKLQQIQKSAQFQNLVLKDIVKSEVEKDGLLQSPHFLNQNTSFPSFAPQNIQNYDKDREREILIKQLQTNTKYFSISDSKKISKYLTKIEQALIKEYGLSSLNKMEQIYNSQKEQEKQQVMEQNVLIEKQEGPQAQQYPSKSEITLSLDQQKAFQEYLKMNQISKQSSANVDQLKPMITKATDKGYLDTEMYHSEQINQEEVSIQPQIEPLVVQGQGMQRNLGDVYDEQESNHYAKEQHIRNVQTCNQEKETIPKNDDCQNSVCFQCKSKVSGSTK